jgi:hypothetical protein
MMDLDGFGNDLLTITRSQETLNVLRDHVAEQGPVAANA